VVKLGDYAGRCRKALHCRVEKFKGEGDANNSFMRASIYAGPRALLQ